MNSVRIGAKIKALRLHKGLTQEELGERTDLSKGFISQLERGLNSPSIETLFSILEVLGTSPKRFFDDELEETKIVYAEDEQTTIADEENRYEMRWLIPSSNEKEMEPVLLTFAKRGQFKRFEPSPAQTFLYVLQGKIRIELGDEIWIADRGNSVYYEAKAPHRIANAADGPSRILLVATHSYL